MQTTVWLSGAARGRDMINTMWMVFNDGNEWLEEVDIENAWDHRMSSANGNKALH